MGVGEHNPSLGGRGAVALDHIHSRTRQHIRSHRRYPRRSTHHRNYSSRCNSHHLCHSCLLLLVEQAEGLELASSHVEWEVVDSWLAASVEEQAVFDASACAGQLEQLLAEQAVAEVVELAGEPVDDQVDELLLGALFCLSVRLFHVFVFLVVPAMVLMHGRQDQMEA